MSLYEGAVKRPIMTSLCFVAVVIFGIFSLVKLPIDLYPEIDTNTIMVLTSYPGASASDIENNVTRPLENTLNSVSNLKHIKSKLSENLSLITLEFKHGNDIDVITNDVRDKLDLVSSRLPESVERPVIFKFSTDMIPIVILSVRAEESTSALYKILEDKVVNPLARVPGVGTVSISGAPKREIQVLCNPNKLEAYRLSIENISAIIGAENRNIPGGNIDVGNETFSLRVEGEFKDTKQLEGVVVGTFNGANVYLRDVATVVDYVQERSQETYNDGVKGATIIVQKQAGANSVEISKKVKSVLPSLQKSLPSDVELGMIVDTSDYILNTIDSLTETVMYALFFVVLVVFLFLGRWRATLIICITIPLSLIASFIYLGMSGNTINIISLSTLSIAIGMVVDDAIVVLENITTHIDRGSAPRQAAVHGTNEVSISVIASTLTMIAVFFPLTLVTGMTGILFRQLGWMMCAILVISTLAALTLTPMLSSQLLKQDNGHRGIMKKFFAPIEKFLSWLDVAYVKTLDWALHHKALVAVICVVFFFASMFAVKNVGSEFFPSQDNSRVTARLQLPVGTRMEVAKGLAAKMTEEWLRDYKDIIRVSSYTVGQADSDNTWASMQDNGSHIISINIGLVDPEYRDITLAEFCDKLRNDINKYPEFVKVKVILGGAESGMGGQSSADFEVYGYSFAETDSVAYQLREKLLNVRGVSEVNISRSEYLPEYQVDFDREKLAMHGLNISTAGTVIRNRINGAIASKYREDGEEYDIKVRNSREFRQSVEDIENILLYNNRGESVRVKDVGVVVERFAPPTIERKDRERIVTVSAVVSGAPLGNVVKDGKAIINKMDIPSGVTVQVSGAYEDQMESFTDLGILAVLITILVFIVMAAQFESLTYPFIIMFSIPFSFFGVFLTLFVTGSNLNVMSLLGAIMLIGIVVKNGIVLIDYIILCRERGFTASKAIIMSGKSRLRPVLMTTATTVLGMIPMAVGSGQGSEMWRPMGVAVIGGLTISTLFTLLIVPTLYYVFAGVGVRRKRRKAMKMLD